MLRKGVYPCECVDDWEKFNETSLPEKADFYSHLNMENITDADYTHAKRDCKDFEIKIVGIIMIYMFKSLYFYYLMYSRTFEICVLKYMNSILLIFFLYQD